MRIILNPNQNTVDIVRKSLKQNGNYCPCALEKTEETKCMCKDFRDKISDPNFKGECHCGLYVKEE